MSLFTDRPNQEPVLPGSSGPDGDRLQSPGGAVPTRVPEGLTHLEYVMGEAADAFERGEWSAGLVNLAHAVFVANRNRAMPDTEVIGLVRRVVGASYHPDLPGPEWPVAALDHTFKDYAENLETGEHEEIGGAFRILYRDEHLAVIDNGEVDDAHGRWLVRDLTSLERAA